MKSVLNLQMNYIVYVLQSRKDGNFYIGQTTNLKIRLRRHSNGDVKSTKHRRPLKLVYTEEFNNRYDALKRERYLKAGPGKQFLKTKLSH